MAAIGKQTLDFEQNVKDIETKIVKGECKDVFKDVFDPLDKEGASLDMTWGLSKTLYLGNSTLMPTKSYLAIHERAKRARAAKFNSKPIYDFAADEFANLKSNRSEEQVRVLRKFSLEGKLNGLSLNESNKVQLQEILNKMTKERVQFKAKTEISTKKFSHTINDLTLIRDIPEELVILLSENPKKALNGPWKVTLQPHVCLPFMEYCPDRENRWNVWQAMVGRGSLQGNKDFETSTHLENIRGLRRDQAKILGYENFVNMSMETKMAGNLENIDAIFNVLLERAKPAQQKELDSLYKFALERGFEGSRIELWDLPFWRRKQRKSLYDYDEKLLMKYFPLPKVLEGLFQLCEKMFNISIRPRSNISTWHKDVRYFDVFEEFSEEPIAGFYFDPYLDSEMKVQQHSGWMVSIQNKSRIAETKPLCALIFYFKPPSGDKPTLLSFKEVNLLFHKFGQAMQHLLSRTTYSEVSGLSNVEWDAVEISGYVFSHFLYNKNVIENITCHVDSDDKLPEYIFKSLINIHEHGAGIDLCRELYLSMLDLHLHSSRDFWLDIVKDLWPQYRCFPLAKNDFHPCSFTQIFCEEWAAAYYSHVWSRVVAADIYSAFHEVQNNEEEMQKVGKRYRDTFLALGGGCHPNQTFRKFRGRDPSPKALLSSLGLKKNKT